MVIIIYYTVLKSVSQELFIRDELTIKLFQINSLLVLSNYSHILIPHCKVLTLTFLKLTDSEMEFTGNIEAP